jgi:Holliday junction resolvase RusA-like endonuclease
MSIETTLSFWVEGIPRPQGSKKAFVRNGRVVLVEASSQLGEWRYQVGLAAKEAIFRDEFWGVYEGPVRVEAVFYFPKPKSVKRELPSVAPDLDKLTRALFDAMTKIVYVDDALVVDLICAKRYSDRPGVDVTVTRL